MPPHVERSLPRFRVRRLERPAPWARFTPGEAGYEGERLLFPQRPSPGKPEVRSAWTRAGDGYRVTRESRDEGGAWKTVFEVVYARATP